MKFKKGDKVYIIKGKDRGKSGQITRVIPDANRIVVEGVMLRKKHVRPKTQDQKGQRVESPAPISASNAMLLCPSCSKPTRIGMRKEGESKVRFCKRCQQSISSK